jgi:hypothetical protein
VKTTPNDTDAIHMPPDLLAEAWKAANEEHRAADELVRDAVRRYLDSRRTERRNEPSRDTSGKNLAQLLMESPFAGAELDLERRKDYARPLEL